MMFGSVFSKTLYDKRFFIFGWALGIAAMFGLIASFYTSMDLTGLDTMLKGVPKGVEVFIGEMAAYGTVPGYIGNAIFGIRFEMLAIPMTLILAISLSVGEERSRKLYQLLAQPVSRRSVLMQKWLAGLLILACIMAVAAAATAGVLEAFNLDVPYDVLLRQTVMAYLFIAALFSLALGLGFTFGSRAIPIIAVVGLVISGYIIKGFAVQVDWMEPFKDFSIFEYYSAADLVRDAIAWKDVGVLVAIGLFGVVAMNITFPYRDLREE